MREDCKNCPEYDPCGKNGKWCFVGALVAEAGNTRMSADVIEPMAQDMAMPIMRDMSTVTINFGNVQSVDVLRDDIRKSFFQNYVIHNEHSTNSYYLYLLQLQ